MRPQSCWPTRKPPNAARSTAKSVAKGGISLYGLQRMPVTLYIEQWERLFGFADELQAFIKSTTRS